MEFFLALAGFEPFLFVYRAFRRTLVGRANLSAATAVKFAHSQRFIEIYLIVFQYVDMTSSTRL